MVETRPEAHACRVATYVMGHVPGKREREGKEISMGMTQIKQRVFQEALLPVKNWKEALTVGAKTCVFAFNSFFGEIPNSRTTTGGIYVTYVPVLNVP